MTGLRSTPIYPTESAPARLGMIGEQRQRVTVGTEPEQHQVHRGHARAVQLDLVVIGPATGPRSPWIRVQRRA